MGDVCNKSKPDKDAKWHTNMTVGRFQLTQAALATHVTVILHCPNCGVQVAAEMPATLIKNRRIV